MRIREKDRIKVWFIVAVSNLLVVSLLGLSLRACQNFTIHGIKYGNLLHAHSHFAFSGWGFMALFIALTSTFLPKEIYSKKVYSRIFSALLIISWGMLISFFAQGYGTISIIFSVLYIIISYWFAFCFYQEIKTINRTISFGFARAALFFLVISTIGPLALGPVMAGGRNNTVLETNLIYYYLHFQYNGWLLFGLLAVFFKWLENNRMAYSPSRARLFFRLMFWGCLPGYLLSVLWSKPPGLIYVIAGLGAMMHLLALLPLHSIIKRDKEKILNLLNPVIRNIGIFVLLDFLLKLVLQLLSAFPPVVRWTIQSRIMVIGYLHLVFLGIVTLFLLLFFLQERISGLNKTVLYGLYIFLSGFLITEMLLFAESFLNINATYIPHFKLWMFYSTISLPIGILFILGGNFIVMFKR